MTTIAMALKDPVDVNVLKAKEILQKESKEQSRQPIYLNIMIGDIIEQSVEDFQKREVVSLQEVRKESQKTQITDNSVNTTHKETHYAKGFFSNLSDIAKYTAISLAFIVLITFMFNKIWGLIAGGVFCCFLGARMYKKINS